MDNKLILRNNCIHLLILKSQRSQWRQTSF